MRPEARRAPLDPGRAVTSTRVIAALALLALGLVLPARPLGAADLTPQQQIESQLMCFCGCSDLTVRTCTCGTADAIRQEIAERLARGESASQVVAAFVARHGEKILSAPTREGFNLLAWIAPFAVLLLAGATLVLAVRRWGAREAGRPAAASAPAGSTPSSAGPPAPLTAAEREVMKRVEREIREGL